MAIPRTKPPKWKDHVPASDLKGAVLGEFPGKIETFEAAGNFQRAVARWPSDLATAGRTPTHGIVYGKDGNELTRVRRGW